MDVSLCVTHVAKIFSSITVKYLKKNYKTSIIFRPTTIPPYLMSRFPSALMSFTQYWNFAKFIVNNNLQLTISLNVFNENCLYGGSRECMGIVYCCSRRKASYCVAMKVSSEEVNHVVSISLSITASITFSLNYRLGITTAARKRDCVSRPNGITRRVEYSCSI